MALPPLKIPLAAAPAAQDHFWVAKLVAETRGAISVEGLMTQLRLDRTMAREVQHLLFKEGIVSAPKAGLATALKPWNIPALAPKVAPTQAASKLAPKPKKPTKLLKSIAEKPENASNEASNKTNKRKAFENQTSLTDQSDLDTDHDLNDN